MIGTTLKPTSFGLAGNYSNISQYKKAINDAIDKRINEFNAVHYNYAPYLKFLVNDAGGSNNFPEVKDLFKESYQQQTIIHMIINNYLVNDKNYSSFIDNLRGDNLCLEINFKSISNDILVKFDKILEKYQITISQYFNRNYLKDFFNEENIELSEMAYKLRNGHNDNEVILVPKNIENKGFFEKFFQLFS